MQVKDGVILAGALLAVSVHPIHLLAGMNISPLAVTGTCLMALVLWMDFFKQIRTKKGAPAK